MAVAAVVALAVVVGLSVAGRRWNARGALFAPPVVVPSISGEGKVAVVTGGNAGLGYEMAKVRSEGEGILQAPTCSRHHRTPLNHC